MTKLVCISDSHHKHYYIDLPEGDILIHAGDWTYRGENIERILVLDYLKSIATKYKYIITIMGNHDIGMDKRWWNHIWNLPNNIHVLQDNSITLEGIKFWGSPYTPKFGDWGFGEPDEKLTKRWQSIDIDVQVLITHGPLRSILDKNKYGEECGSKSLYHRIKTLKNLKHHIFGHIHESYGCEVQDSINFWNVSILDENYQIKNKPTVIEI